MDLATALLQRRMVRSYADRPLPEGLVDRMVLAALRSPTAGHSRGTAWVVLEGPDETARYWSAATTADWRARARRWPGLSRAAAVAVAVACPSAYEARYAEPDKDAASAPGGATAWPVPYWVADAAFGVMTLLLEATGEGVGACFLGNFRSEHAVLDALAVPAEWRLFGAVPLGYPDGEDHRSASLARPGPARPERLHRGWWGGPPTDGRPPRRASP